MKFFGSKLKLTSLYFLLLFTAVISFSSCSTTEYKYPSINETSTKEYTYGHVVWRDLVTADPKKAADFYSKVFGWQVQDLSKDDVKYWIFKNNGKPVAGMYLIPNKKADRDAEWVCTISVPSVETAASLTKANGGNIIIEPFDMNGRGKVSLLSDPQKAPFAVIKSSKGDPPIKEPQINEWLWSENWANNPEEAINFYKTILNAQIEKKMDDEREYTVLVNGGNRTEGIIKNPVDKVRSHWMQYILVSDVDKVTKKAKDNGAEILLAPDSTVRNGSVAVFLDPTGAPVSIQKWPVK